MSSTPVVHDISVLLGPGTPEWPGDVAYTCGWTQRMESGGGYNLSHFAMSPHVGSHADAPLHVLPDGAASDAFPLEIFRGPAHLVELTGAMRDRAHPVEPTIEMADLAPLLPERVERLLLRTGHTTADGSFPGPWPALSPACIGALCERGLRLLGVDAPSIDPRERKSLDTHRALFSRGGYNLESLDLRNVPPGAYELVAYPLRLEGLDAAPVRAVLLGTR
jgi:arylformamidase